MCDRSCHESHCCSSRAPKGRPALAVMHAREHCQLHWHQLSATSASTASDSVLLPALNPQVTSVPGAQLLVSVSMCICVQATMPPSHHPPTPLSLLICGRACRC